MQTIHNTLNHNELSCRTVKICLYCHAGQQQPGTRYR